MQTCEQETDRAPCHIDFAVIRDALDALGGKWKLLLLTYLHEGTKRFGDLKRLVPEISEKMLAQCLRELERDGLVRRRSYSEVPPRVEYTLTALGEETMPLLQALYIWGQRSRGS